MTIDLKRYEGHMLDGARDGGPTEYRNQRAIAPSIGVLYGAGPALDATVALVIDAPALLAEVVRLRADLAEAVAALRELSHYAETSDDCQYGTLSTRLVRDIAAPVLAKHGGA